MEIFTYLNFYLFKSTNNKNINFYNFNNTLTYLNFFNDFNNKNNQIISLNTVSINDVTKNNKNLPYYKNYQNKTKELISFDNLFYMNQSISNNSKDNVKQSNIFFIKNHKIYNKGRFSRNKQIYRTGVI